MSRTLKIVGIGICALLAVDAWVFSDAIRERYEQWQVEGTRGFSRRTYPVEPSEQRAYALFLPHEMPANTKLPLIMYLGGAGENGSDGLTQISINFGLQVWEMRKQFPFVALAAQCRRGGKWEPGSLDTQRAFDLLDRVIEKHNVDPDRIYLTGVSSGGGGAWRIAAAYPERFAAMVALCGATPGSVSELQGLIDASLPVWNFVNLADSPGLSASSQRSQEVLINHGLSPHFTEYAHQFDATNPHDCWNFAYRNPAMYEWLLRQSRSRNVRQQKFTRILNDPSLSGWSRVGAADWRVSEGVLESVVDESAVGRSRLLCGQAHEAFDLHFDWRCSGTGSCEIVLLKADEDESSDTAVRVVIAFPSVGTGGVFDGRDKKWLTGTDPIAQRSLLPERWNDIRLQVADGHVNVAANGLPIIDVEIPRLRETAVRAGLEAFSETPGQEWRYVRMRSLDHDRGGP